MNGLLTVSLCLLTFSGLQAAAAEALPVGAEQVFQDDFERAELGPDW